jgi:hypothetical protein
VADIRFFIVAYNLSIDKETRNFESISYKAVCLISFLALLSPFWISYSGIVAIKYSQGSFDPNVTKKDKWGTFM